MIHRDCKESDKLVLPEDSAILLEAIERVGAALCTVDKELARARLPWQQWTRHILLEMEAEYLEDYTRMVLALDRQRERGDYDGPRFF